VYLASNFGQHKVQNDKEQVEYFMAICVFDDIKCVIMPYIIV